MTRRRFLAGAGALFLVPGSAARATPRRIAVISRADGGQMAPFLEGLRELGWHDGRDIDIAPPWPKASYVHLPGMADAAVGHRADVIVAFGATAAAAAKRATRRIPIVMVVGTDPIETGLVKSLARPEGNITGIATTRHLLVTKRAELLKETLPGMRRLAALWHSESAGQRASLKVLGEWAERAGVMLVRLDLLAMEEAPGGLQRAIGAARADALLPLVSRRSLGLETIRLAAQHRLPAVYGNAALARAGGLLAYSPDGAAQRRRAASYVDRLLKGAKPSDLPIEQPAKFDLVVNMHTARSLGLALPQSILLRAGEVIG